MNKLGVWCNGKEGNKWLKDIRIVYERVGGGYGIGYWEGVRWGFGEVERRKGWIEVKMEFGEVGRVGVGDWWMVVGMCKGKLEVEGGCVIMEEVGWMDGMVCREIKLGVVCCWVDGIGDG